MHSDYPITHTHAAVLFCLNMHKTDEIMQLQASCLIAADLCVYFTRT